MPHRAMASRVWLFPAFPSNFGSAGAERQDCAGCAGKPAAF
jgi:hypothetical protein